MNTPRDRLILLRASLLALGLLALSACAGGDSLLGAADDADSCASAADCEEPARLSTQVRLDAEAMLAGMAHARARLGLQEDAAP